MSKHFTAFQYEPAYQPKALRNWEVPHYYCNRPKKRTGRTRVISNNQGNLLPGIPRPPTTAWGNYIGTWHLPRRIDRKTADILNGTAELEANKEKCRLYLLAQRKKSEEFEEAEKPAPAAPAGAAPAAETEDKEEAKEEIKICPIHGPF